MLFIKMISRCGVYEILLKEVYNHLDNDMTEVKVTHIARGV